MLTGEIGRLQTLNVINVVAGDIFKLNYDAQFRLSRLRQALSIDCIIDLFSFYSPYRHTYGDDWINLVKDGPDGSVTLSSFTTPADNINVMCLGGDILPNTTIPDYRWKPYNEIYNWFFRNPNLTPEITSDYYPSTSGFPTNHNGNNSPLFNDNEQKKYGYRCGRKKRMFTVGMDASVDSTDWTYAAPVATTANISLLDLARQKAQLKRERKIDYTGNRYYDQIGRAHV